MPEACNIQHKIQQIMNIVKTNFYRIQVYKCFAQSMILDRNMKTRLQKNFFKNLNDENNARFSANVVIHTVKMLMNIS